MSQELSFPQQAARASWIAPIVAAGFVMFSRNIPSRSAVASLIVGSVAYLFYIVGLVLAVVALAGMRRVGKNRVLVPAVIGLVINGALVITFTSLLLHLLLSRSAAP